jgi:hypothetical protein
MDSFKLEGTGHAPSARPQLILPISHGESQLDPKRLAGRTNLTLRGTRGTSP